MFLHGVKKLPSRYIWIFAVFPDHVLFCFIMQPGVSAVFIVSLAIVLSLYGALAYKFAAGSYKQVSKTRKIGAMACLSLITIAIGAG